MRRRERWRPALFSTIQSALPGYFVRVRIASRRQQPALLVPNVALGSDQGGPYVLVVNQDNVVEQRKVDAGQVIGDLRVIESGLGKDDRVIVGPGEICVWHSGRPVSFEMPEKFDKLCMIVPIARFESVLYNAETYEGLRLPRGSNLATLLGSYLSTLTDSVMTRNDNTPFDAIDVTLELLGAAFRAQRRSSTIAPRDQLFARISNDIEARLNDVNLSPTRIADANGISIRYLYTLFNEQGETVSGWVRRRRLLRCRAELDGADTEASITEIAYRWGFNDSAHFSRLFKASFGMSPTQYRSSRCLGASDK